MASNTTEGVNFRVVSMGRDEVDSRRPCNFRPLTLENLYQWIDSKNLEPRIKAELKAMAGQWPQQALPVWQKSYTRHLVIAQNKVRNGPAPEPKPLGEDDEKDKADGNFDERGGEEGHLPDDRYENPGQD